MAVMPRLIPVLLLKGGLIVRSEEFRYHQVIGDPTTQLTRYSEWEADELIYLDIRAGSEIDVGRADAKITTQDRSSALGILEDIAGASLMPLTVGGGIRTIDDMHRRFDMGADKITLNTVVFDEPELVGQAASTFGSQAIVASIDARQTSDGTYVAVKGGQEPSDLDVCDLARRVVAAGAGEILINSVDRDGTATGFDLQLIERMAKAVGDVPLVALGGGSRAKHFAAALEAGADAVAAANVFHFTEMSYVHIKDTLHRAGIPVRVPSGSPLYAA